VGGSVGAGAEPPAGLINLGSAGGAEGIDEKEEDAGGLHAGWLLMEGWADERGGEERREAGREAICKQWKGGKSWQIDETVSLWIRRHINMLSSSN